MSEFNETLTFLLKDEPPGYRPPTFGPDLRAAAELYSTHETDALLALKVDQSEFDATVISLNADLATKAPINSPTFTGSPAAPTPATSVNNSQLATTAYVINRINFQYTAADVLAKLLTVDGPGSGLDADLLGGIASASYALLASPAFSGNPTAPNQSAGDISTRIATTQHVTDKVNLAFAVNYTPADILAKLKTVDGAGSGLDTDFFRGLAPSDFVQTSQITAYAPLNSPAFTGSPTAPTPAVGDNTTRIATTAFVATSFAKLDSPAFTGAPTAPTQAASDSSTKIATTANVDAKITALKAAANIWGSDQTFSQGIDFGSGVAASPSDLSRHIALYGTTYGFSVTGSQLNHVSGADHVFYNGANEVARISSAGALTLDTPLAIAEGGTGGTTAASARTALGLAAIAASGSASDLISGVVPNGRISGAYSGITTLDTTGRMTVTQAGEAIRINGPNAADDPYLTFYAGGVRTAYIQHTDGTGLGAGFRMFNDVTNDYLFLHNVNSANALKFFDASVGIDQTVWHSGNLGTDDINAVPTSRQVIAGNGLTGGGALSSDRTLTLGTPGSITNSTTNSVTSTSHTHALGFTAAEVSTTSSSTTTSFSLGHTIQMYTAGADVQRNEAAVPCLSSSDTKFYRLQGTTNAGTALSGTWRGRGHLGNDYSMMERVA